MSEYSVHKDMLKLVASALGPEVMSKVAFVGGCTTGLLLTDELARQAVRHTLDVDLIVPVVGNVGWIRLQESLRGKGFTDDLLGDSPACAMKLGDLRVDFMPEDPSILGFGNKWYSEALNTAININVDSVPIRVVSPVYFLATKLEAFKGRGNGDVLASQDVEDILNLINGRSEIVNEVASAESGVRGYISDGINGLLSNSGIDYAVTSAAEGDSGLAEVIYERMEAIGKGVNE